MQRGTKNDADRRFDRGARSSRSCHRAPTLRGLLVVSAAIAAGLLACQDGTRSPVGETEVENETVGSEPEARSTGSEPTGRAEPFEPTTPFARDLDRICHGEERSGALEKPRGERPMLVAYWLANNIESQDGREFLGRFGRSDASGKVALLDSETRRVGLSSCPLIERWKVEQVRP